MKVIIKQAPAKVNLMLKITGNIGDYHRMQSIFTFVKKPSDTMFFYPELEFNTQKSANIANIPNENNLIHKAYYFLKDIYGENSKFPDVRIEKSIPMMAGLGGGSSNAACFIYTVLKIWNIPTNEIIAVSNKAYSIGMDVPIFLYHYIFEKNYLELNGIGIFNEIKTCDEVDQNILIVHNPKIQLSTKLVFDTYDKMNDNKTRSTNSLENAAIKIVPEILNILNEIKETGALTASISGSGSACFGTYSNNHLMKKAERYRKKKYKVYSN